MSHYLFPADGQHRFMEDWVEPGLNWNWKHGFETF